MAGGKSVPTGTRRPGGWWDGIKMNSPKEFIVAVGGWGTKNSLDLCVPRSVKRGKETLEHKVAEEEKPGSPLLSLKPSKVQSLKR